LIQDLKAAKTGGTSGEAIDLARQGQVALRDPSFARTIARSGP
jgi:hypothetical protein